MDQQSSPALPSHSIDLRVRYSETDGQGRVHHAQYINYFERGRVELLRAIGHSYRELEESGIMLVVSEMNVRYLGAAVFDDVLELTTSVVKTRGTRIEHHYRIVKREPQDGDGGQAMSEVTTVEIPIVEGTSVVACVDRTGKVQRLPSFLRTERRKSSSE